MHNHKVFPHADKISLIRRLLIFFKFKEITAREKIADQIRSKGSIFIEEKICKGINFWIIKIKTINLYGLISKIDKSQLWNGGIPSLNKIEVIIMIEIIEGAETRKPKVEKIKKIDAILWEIKYFNLISLEKKDDFAPIKGKTDTMFNSKLTHKKKLFVKRRL